MNKIISIVFVLLPIALSLTIGIWRRNQIYRQEEEAEQENPQVSSDIKQMKVE